MGAIDPRKAGVGSGVLNAARQVGGALGIAVLGSVAATITTSAWQDKTVGMGGVYVTQADRLKQLVEGSQAQAVNALAGPDAMLLAMESWMEGFRASVLAGAFLMAAAVVVVIVGFRGVAKPQSAPVMDSSDTPPAVEL